MLGQLLCLAESPLQVNVSNTVLPAGGGIPAETTPPLKLKLVLSPNKEAPKKGQCTITVDILFKSLLLKFLKQIIRVFLLLIDKRRCFKRQANSSFTLQREVDIL